ncbi:hypothetical protein RD792_012984 [Penstemon davidsonii]|uniref:C3H1-type domain-containing protein n=1 Tax=Penstemon davidsonii TaxID=160366 RepID=A0ABR0CS98_9LAMI|nr:hypothetical protein RD792_012984 [Penstemon davidsonii]
MNMILQVVKEKVKHREENSERAWQTECKYYLTSGGCKYGNACKFSHGSEKTSISPNIPEFNFLGLPIRLGEKECPYYMRNGSCKYGSTCRFHHPEPTSTGSPLPSQLVSSSWSSPYLPPTQTVPTPNPDWNRYQVPYTKSEGSLPTPPAFAINNLLPTEINFPMQQHHHNHHSQVIEEEYPLRPGEPECSFFLKTGDCKFKSTCKFHHPKNRITKAKTKAKASSSALNDQGLPLRPDQPICTNYHRYGICKYGPACKYDHPSNYTEVEER